MDDETVCFQSAVELSDLIASKRLSPVELMSAVIDRFERLNPTLNAVCTPTLEAAHQSAKASERRIMQSEPLGLLEGIPCTIKDLAFTKGVRTMAGSHIFAERIPDVDAPFVTRLAQAGAISLGKTTVPEFGWKGCGDSPLTGASHNPWKHGMNAGGSSTGAAICAAAGIGPIHQGSDGAGSIRMPAAFCGIYGLKPSYGRVPYFPATNNDHMSHVGPMTRTVADAALMLQVMSGPDDRDQASLETPAVDYLSHLDVDINTLKIAYSPDLGHLKVDDEIAQSVRGAVSTFESLGCVVDEIDPGWEDPTEMELFFYASNFAGNMRAHMPRWRDQLDPGLVACADDGLKFSAADYVEMRAQRMAYYNQVQSLFERYDLLLTPSLSVAAFPVHQLIPDHWEQHPWDWIRWAGFSYPFNLTWLPAATCPCGFTQAGLPIGIQIVAGRHQDLRVLQASRAFEQAQPWAQHRPSVQ